MTNEQIIWNYFKNKEFTDAGIAGLMGNLYAESGLNPKNLQNSFERKLNYTDELYTQAVDNQTYNNFVQDRAGYGLAQWTYWSRKQNLLNYAQSKKSSIGNLSMQLEFLYKELSESFPKVLKVLKTTDSVQEASNIVLLQFERPADQSEAVQKRRYDYSMVYYNKYVNQTPEEGSFSKMKYSKSNPPLICMQTHSTCYRNTRTMNVLGILWHSTGANNPNLKRYVQPYEGESNYDEMIALLGKNYYGNDWNHIEHQAGLNAWIGKLANGSIATVQTMPWNYRPWGCGSGKNGSCNSGWIQFEICEDALTDSNYFNAVYQEACELTAYLCTLYNIDPKGTVEYNGITVPTILCHRDSYDLGLGGGHADVLHWFPKHGKDMNSVRNDVAALMKTTTIIAPTPAPTPVLPLNKELYRVRKSWTDYKSQIGAYANLNNAIEMCKKAGPEYDVYNMAGEMVYTNETLTPVLQVGDICRIKSGAKWVSGGTVPRWVINSKMYLREIRKNGDYIVSTMASGPITGVINPKYVYTEDFQEYKVIINTAVLNVRAAAGIAAKKLGTVRKGTKVTVLAESNNWGKIKYNGKDGWISLLYTKKV